MSELMITEGDVESFRRKFEQWGATLTDAEQAIMHMVTVRAFAAAPAEPEVEGFMHEFQITMKPDTSSPQLAAFGPGTIDQFIGMTLIVANPSFQRPGPPV